MNRLQGPKGRGGRWAAFALLAALGPWLACVSERGVQPVAPKYLLYIGWSGLVSDLAAYIEQYDPELDSTVGTIHGGFGLFDTRVDLVTSPDGRWMATQVSQRPPLIWDVVSGTMIGAVPGVPSVYNQLPLFLPNQDAILTVYKDSVVVLSLPGLNRIALWPDFIRYPQIIPSTGQVIAIGASDTAAGSLKYTFYIADTDNGSIVDTMSLTPDSWLTDVLIWRYCTSASGEQLYALALTRDSGAIALGWDLREDRVLFAEHIWTINGRCAVSPDGDELWVTDPGSWDGLEPVWPGLIHVFNARSGTRLATIETQGIDPQHAESPLFVLDVVFHPDRPEAYIAAGWRSSGPILVIDTETKSVVDEIWHSSRRSPVSIDLAPSVP